MSSSLRRETFLSSKSAANFIRRRNIIHPARQSFLRSKRRDAASGPAGSNSIATYSIPRLWRTRGASSAKSTPTFYVWLKWKVAPRLSISTSASSKARTATATSCSAHSYSYKLLIDGNDPRGIDVALFSRYELRNLRSHVEDKIDNHEIFSRDCAEYQVILPSGKSLWMLCNHFKSRGYGNPADNDAKRLKQSTRVHKILQRFDLKKDLVVVAGDFNELPDSPSLAPLLQDTAHLHNAFAKLASDADQWTHKDDVAKNKQIDYLLLSEPLFTGCEKVGIERRGIYSKTNFKAKCPHFDAVTSESTQASDHACVWADFAL